MISAADVRALLDAGPDSVLVVIGGRARVLDRSELDEPDNRGAFEVITRAELMRHAGGELSDREVEEQAAALDAAVSELGG